jgi:hypothetical protein
MCFPVALLGIRLTSGEKMNEVEEARNRVSELEHTRDNAGQELNKLLLEVSKAEELVSRNCEKECAGKQLYRLVQLLIYGQTEEAVR